MMAPRRAVVAMAVALGVCFGVLYVHLARSPTALAQEAAALQLVELGILAGVRDEDGSRNETKALPVFVAQDGGTLAFRTAVSEAVAADPGFSVADGPALLRVEAVGDPHAFALRLSVWRRGFSVVARKPVVRRSLPTAVVICGGLILVGVGLRRRAVVVLAQIGLVAVAVGWPWPATLAALPGTDPHDLLAGPGMQWTAVALERLGAAGALGLGFVAVAAAILAGFDHRRSQRDGTALTARQALVAAGQVALGLLAAGAALRLGAAVTLTSGRGLAVLATFFVAAALLGAGGERSS